MRLFVGIDGGVGGLLSELVRGGLPSGEVGALEVEESGDKVGKDSAEDGGIEGDEVLYVDVFDADGGSNKQDQYKEGNFDGVDSPGPWFLPAQYHENPFPS